MEGGGVTEQRLVDTYNRFMERPRTRTEAIVSSNRTLDADGLVIGKKDAIYTFTGGMIRPLDPNPDDINIEDIAHALSNQCRYTGHTSRFYSVAEHCLLATAIVEDEYDNNYDGAAVELHVATLLHDASEAYLSDIARPIKKAPGFAETYLKYEAALERAIGVRFGIPGEMHPATRWADERILGIEVHTLLPAVFREAYGEIAPWAPRLEPIGLPPRAAEVEFLEAYARLSAQRVQA